MVRYNDLVSNVSLIGTTITSGTINQSPSMQVTERCFVVSRKYRDVAGQDKSLSPVPRCHPNWMWPRTEQ